MKKMREKVGNSLNGKFLNAMIYLYLVVLHPKLIRLEVGYAERNSQDSTI